MAVKPPSEANPSFQVRLEATEGRLNHLPLNLLDSLFPYVDVQANGVANDYAAIQARFDLVAATPGRSCFAPRGTYRYETALAPPEGMGLFGEGRATVLKPAGCDGLVFDVSDYIGPTVFENFYIQGDATYTKVGIKALGDADSGRVTGITVRDVLISHFKTGIHLRSTTDWHITHVNGTDCWEGIRINGQTIRPVIDGGTHFSKGTATGTGDSYGLHIDKASDYNPGGTTEKAPEGVRVRDTTFFGFDVCVEYLLCLDGRFEALTLDLYTKVGFRYAVTNGDLTIKNCWISPTGTSATYGIHGQALGALADTKTTIEDNRIEGVGTLNAASIGIYIASRQAADVLGNTIKGFLGNDIKLDFASMCNVKRNRCRSTGVSSSIYLVCTVTGRGPYILDENYVAVQMEQHASNVGRMEIGSTYGAQSTLIHGTSTIPNGLTTVTTTFASLSDAPPNFISGAPSRYVPALEIHAPGANLGAVWGTVSDSQVVLNCSTAAVGAQVVRWTAYAVPVAN